jgi:hypothetical protein
MDDPQEKQERRKSSRAILFAKVVFHRLNSAEPDRISITQNISRGGTCIISSEPLKEKEVLDLTIHLPNEDTPVKIFGKVIWAKEYAISEAVQLKRYSVGLEFIGADNKTLDKIDRYVASQANPVKR